MNHGQPAENNTTLVYEDQLSLGSIPLVLALRPQPMYALTPKGGSPVFRGMLPRSDILKWVMFYSNRQAIITSIEGSVFR